RNLKRSYTERLKNESRKSRYFSRGRYNYSSEQLSRKARSEAESSLGQLESSSAKINEAMAKKKEIEELIEDAKSVLSNLER
ncbi:P12 family lipoprotein, partial [Borrelia hermsii]|uniref:P12 family lipoprotein n=1 Tax=Borrelia hermsii TaxID=140 RepID=UPI00046CA0DD